jgi:TonB-dependent receptor
MTKISTPSSRLATATVSLLALAIAAVGTAQAQQASTQATNGSAPKAADSTVVVVTGFRKAYADALKTKRDTIEISDSISSDGLGRFPDLNLGEAIQRIPGVQINREADSRAATINLRGLPGTYARTTMNGVGFADPILNGSTPMGAFNSDIFSEVTVIKSPTAADIAGGLSGNIDLRVAPALQRKDGGFIKVGEEYDELGKLSSPSATLSGTHHFSPDLAVFGVIASKKQNFRRDSIFVNTYSKLTAAQVPNLATLYPASQYPHGVQYPSQVRQVVLDNIGNQVSGAAGFDWRINDNWKLSTTAMYTDNDLKNEVDDLLYIDTSASSASPTGATAHITPTGAPYIISEPSGQNAYINAFSFTNAAITDSTRNQPTHQWTYVIDPTLEFHNEAWRFTAEGTLSRAQSLANQIEIDVVQNNRANNLGGNNGISGSIYTGGTDLNHMQFVLNTPNASHIDPGPYNQSSSATQLSNAFNDRFGLTGTNGKANNSLDALQLDGERFLGSNPFLTSLQFGARYEAGKYASSGNRNTAQGTIASNVNSGLSVQNPFSTDFFGGDAAGYTQNWRAVNIDQVLAALTPVNWPLNPSAGVFLTPYGLVNNASDSNFFLNNFTDTNHITSAYVMAKLDTKVFGIRVRGDAGLRYEDTKNTIVAVIRPGTGNLVSQTTRQHYDNLLPSLVLAASLTEKLELRAAAYSTYVRPQPRDITPVTGVTAPGSGSDIYTVSIGNALLKPYKANSYDVSLEWYNRKNGLVSIDAFEKDISGFIEPITDLNILCPANGLINGNDLGLGNLHWDATQGKCFSDKTTNIGTAGSPNLQPNQIVASGNHNGAPLKVKGVEFDVQQNLDFLPSFWKNFGGAMNYAYTEIDGRNPDGSKAILPGVSKNNVNLIGYYETPKYGVRLVYNYRDKYGLAAGSTYVGAARTVKARGQLDASASYHINDYITVSVDGFNLTDATRAEYENSPMKPRRIDYDGRTFEASLQATF